MREYAERDYDVEISGIENQIRSNQDYYENLGQQIGELSRDKELYDEGEWNSLYDEKAGAPSDEEIPETPDDGDYLDDESLEEN